MLPRLGLGLGPLGFIVGLGVRLYEQMLKPMLWKRRGDQNFLVDWNGLHIHLEALRTLAACWRRHFASPGMITWQCGWAWVHDGWYICAKPLGMPSDNPWNPVTRSQKGFKIKRFLDFWGEFEWQFLDEQMKKLSSTPNQFLIFGCRIFCRTIFPSNVDRWIEISKALHWRGSS